MVLGPKLGFEPTLIVAVRPTWLDLLLRINLLLSML